MDRWNIVSTLNYLEPEKEEAIILSKCKFLEHEDGKQMVKNMVKIANLTRNGFANGDISTVMSPRTVITWADNYNIFKNLSHSFKVSFLNKCDELEKSIVNEYYQRCFGSEISIPSTEKSVGKINGR